MMNNVHLLLVVLALISTLVSAATGKLPLWLPVLLLCIALVV